MREQILQKLIDGGGKYFIANRYIEDRNGGDWESLVIAPDVSRELWGKQILELPYKDVRNFADKEIKTIIHLGKTYQPFQYGIRNKDFIDLEEITCPPMELVVKCYIENIKDFHEVRKLMKTLTPENES